MLLAKQKSARFFWQNSASQRLFNFFLTKQQNMENTFAAQQKISSAQLKSIRKWNDYMVKDIEYF